MEKTLDELLEDWQVEELDFEDIEDIHGIAVAKYLEGWFGVSNTDGIIAYFGKEDDALRFRLNEINRQLNG